MPDPDADALLGPGTLSSSSPSAVVPAFRADDDGADDDGAAGARRPVTSVFQRCIPGPPWVLNILLSELCERFSFYALRAVLVLFLVERLGWSDDAAISMFFASSALAYYMPLLGGYVADAKLGKFKTIVGFSCIYIAGCFFLALSAFVSPDPVPLGNATVSGSGGGGGDDAAQEAARERAEAESTGGQGESATVQNSAGAAAITVFALVLIAIGTGGIKPNVSSFGADQFADSPGGPDEVGRFFAVFYFCINCGSVASFIVSPILRVNAGYGVTFALPCALLIVATLILWAGRRQYVQKPPGRSPVGIFFHVIVTARRERSSGGVPAGAAGRRGHHWMRAAEGQPGCGPQEVKDSIAVWRQCSVLATLPIFWMLYDQQGSAWTLQAETMDLHGFLEPEQLGVLNPVLILCLLPIFENVIYPAWEASAFGARYPPTPLFRIGVGMLFAALAFVISGLVQATIDGNAHPNSVSVFLQLPQILVISISEILVSVTSLEFAYAQAPNSMKATCTSLYLLTTAVGDTLGAAMYANLGPVMGSSGLFFFCAVMMVLNTVLFVAVARRFVPRNPRADTMDDAVVLGEMGGYEAPAPKPVAAPLPPWDARGGGGEEEEDDDDDDDDAAMGAI